ncbi:hypothetical protein FCK90_08145 [Kocuria coralli]|uniref:Uncharacterized protein n=1 Tax=Kocuria coralli TaxID=1461025 RepID=A0A5J5KZS6_9MICC|nr:hypothetical protein [Kocuria coralli]KAA9394211.1 hypothetical protein FCK90_08145 [Kocuria coralli]
MLVLIAVIWEWIPVPEILGRVSAAVVLAGLVLAAVRWIGSRSPRTAPTDRPIAREVRSSAARSTWSGTIAGLSAQELPAAAQILDATSLEYAVESIDPGDGVLVLRKLPGMRSYGSFVTIRQLNDGPEYRYEVSSAPAPRTILLDFGGSRRDVLWAVSSLRAISALGRTGAEAPGSGPER